MNCCSEWLIVSRGPSLFCFKKRVCACDCLVTLRSGQSFPQPHKQITQRERWILTKKKEYVQIKKMSTFCSSCFNFYVSTLFNPFCSTSFSGNWWCINAAAAASHDITAAGQEQKQTWCYCGLTEKVNCAKPVTPKFSVCWLKVQAIFSSFSWEGEVMGGGGAAYGGVMPEKA